ncbi:S26 family signal peptidase [Pacificimonas sp. WHA3]|uniref:S26 family signal peptidase n=1 Tax=Pacificimonas pallii TaxID=2827236 RepID=A0ABS6SBU3_9SPHN|nr:S26 family signal peptidase [Pacificimonas pallii]MBV7255890.1 S26 family signal peptidase [Pacificimonas pallii]
MTRARRTLSFAGVAIGLIGASAAVRSDPILIWNASASVPVGVYFVTPLRDPQVGDLAVVRPPEELSNWLVARGYLGHDTPLLKHIAGLPGAEVCRFGITITIDGASVATAQTADRHVRPLPVWSGCRVLREGEVFFLNRREPASLDGRYFGPLDTDTIIGRAVPIWTRED